MQDQQILSLLREGRQDKALVKLYHYYPKIQQLILSKGGSKEDAKDIYQEALIIFCQKARKPDFQLTSAIGTYLYSVSRFLWKDEQEKRQRRPTGEFHSGLDQAEESELQAQHDKEQRLAQAMDVLQALGERCWQLLQLFYFKAMRMNEIAQHMGFSSEKVAKNQKYKCMERAKLRLKALKQGVVAS